MYLTPVCAAIGGRRSQNRKPAEAPRCVYQCTVMFGACRFRIEINGRHEFLRPGFFGGMNFTTSSLHRSSNTAGPKVSQVSAGWREYEATASGTKPVRTPGQTVLPEAVARVSNTRNQTDITLKTSSSGARVVNGAQERFAERTSAILEGAYRAEQEHPRQSSFVADAAANQTRMRDPILKHDHADAFRPPQNCGLSGSPETHYRRDPHLIGQEDKHQALQTLNSKLGARLVAEERILETYAEEDEEAAKLEARHLNGVRRQKEAYLASLGGN